MKITLIIITLSFLADQILQFKSVRDTKHKSTTSLILHVATWSVPMLIFSTLVFLRTGNDSIVFWQAILMIAHFLIEWCCIRMWSYLWYDKKRSLMVFWILLDQILLNIAMIVSFDYFIG